MIVTFNILASCWFQVGDFFPEFLDILESDPFLKASMPWGSLSMLSKMESRCESNDGPIMWARPGEQMVPTADMSKGSPLKRKRYRYFKSFYQFPVDIYLIKMYVPLPFPSLLCAVHQ